MVDELEAATKRLQEELLYKVVADEIKNEQIREGLMAKALVETSGNKEQARLLYIKYRIQSIIDETNLKEAEEKLAETARQNAERQRRKAEAEGMRADAAKREAEEKQNKDIEASLKKANIQREKERAKTQAAEDKRQAKEKKIAAIKERNLRAAENKRRIEKTIKQRKQFQHIRKVISAYSECSQDKTNGCWYLKERGHDPESFESFEDFEARATTIFAKYQPIKFRQTLSLPPRPVGRGKFYIAILGGVIVLSLILS